MTTSTTDRIEKEIYLKAPPARVFRALTDAAEFGAWFGVLLEGRFAVGERARGRIAHPGYEHLAMELSVERMEPDRLFSYRWHPYAVDPAVDYSAEPTTLVEFHLEEAEGGTLLRVVESGFDSVPAARRAEAYRMNERGWGIQMENILRHVSG